jgi:hypothetical protein
LDFAVPSNFQKSLSMAATISTSNSSTDTGNASKRLQKELMGLMMSKDDGISAFPDADNILSWTGTIDGRSKSNFSFDFPIFCTPFETTAKQVLQERFLKGCLISSRSRFQVITLVLHQQSSS